MKGYADLIVRVDCGSDGPEFACECGDGAGSPETTSRGGAVLGSSMFIENSAPGVKSTRA